MPAKSAKEYREDARHLRALAALHKEDNERSAPLGMADLFEYFAKRAESSTQRRELGTACDSNRAPAGAVGLEKAGQLVDQQANPSPSREGTKEHQQETTPP